MSKLIHKKDTITGKDYLGKIETSEINGTLDAHYIHNQTTPASTWNIQHNLDKYPSVTVVDSADSVVTGNIIFTDSNNLTINFIGSFAGKAYLN